MRMLADTIPPSSGVYQLTQDNVIEERKRGSLKLQPKISKEEPTLSRDAIHLYLSFFSPDTSEASSNIRNPRIASSVLPGVVAALYVRQESRRPPLSRSAPMDRRRLFLCLQESRGPSLTNLFFLKG